MKKCSAFVVVCFFLMAFLIGCGKEEGYDYHSGFYTGKQSFESLENNIASILSFFDLSLRMNAYLEQTEEERSDSMNRYFPNYQIVMDGEGNWLGLKEQDTIFKIITDDLALTTETAQWDIIGYETPYEGKITILCTNLRCWDFNVTAIENRGWISEADLKINYSGEGNPRNFNDGDWIVSGRGKSVAEHESIMNFEIAESLIRFANSKYLFNRGMLYLQLKDLLSLKEEVVKVEMKSIMENDRSLQITCGGELYSY